MKKAKVYLLKYYSPHICINNAITYRQKIFNQLNTMVPYVDIIGLCYSVAIWW